MLSEVARILELVVRDNAPTATFNELLDGLLRLTGSTYGYVGEVHHDDGVPWLRTWAITDISWNSETRQLYQDLVVHGQGLEFRRLDTLFGWGLRQGGRIVCSNDPSHDPRALGRPAGHPPLESFLALPLRRGGELIGQLAVANRVDGYDQAVVDALAPFVAAVTSVLERTRLDRERRDAEQQTNTHRRRARVLWRYLRDAVIVVDDNDEIRQVIGGPILGMNWHGALPVSPARFVHPEDLEMLMSTADEVRRSGQEASLVCRFLSEDGQLYVLEMVLQDKRSDPDVEGLLVTVHDVTRLVLAEQQAAQTELELTTLVRGLQDAVLFLNQDRLVVYVNEAFCTLWGYDDPSSLIGMQTPTDRSLRSGQLAEALERVGRRIANPAAFLAGVARNYESEVAELGVRVEYLDGSVRERDYLPVVHGGLVAGHIWLYRDVTERDRVEQARTHELERVAEQNRSLQELHRLKTEFLAMVSHELATPITSVVNFADMLADELHAGTAEGRDSLPGNAGSYLEILQRNADRLVRLVADLLLIAKLDANVVLLDVADTDLDELVRTTVATFAPEIAAQGLHLVLDLAPGTGRLDAVRIEQVLGNLLSNAIKFNTPGGTLSVTTRLTDTQWEIAVCDDGIGISAADAQRVDEPFYRGGNAVDGQIPGSGLGLSVARGIVEQHGGRLTLRALDTGSEALVTLPLNVTR